MMSTLEASQDIRSLSDDVRDMVEPAFPLEKHKDFKDSTEMPAQDLSEDSNLNTPKSSESPVEAHGDAETLQDAKADEEVLSKEVISVEEIESDSESGKIGINAVVEEPEKCEEKCESSQKDAVELISNGSGQECERIDSPKSDNEGNFEENSQDVNCGNEEDSKEASDVLEVAEEEMHEVKTVDPEDIDLGCNDVVQTSDENAATKMSDTEDIIDLDDMLKEIGVDNPEQNLEAKQEDSKSESESPEKPEQEIEEDDEVMMMELDEDALEDKETEDKAEEARPESKGDKTSDEPFEETDILKECDELLKSFSDEKPSDHVPSIAIDEDTSDLLEKKTEAESEVQDKDDSLKLVIDEENMTDEPEDKAETPKADSKVDESVAENGDETSKVDMQTAEETGSKDLANNSDDILIIDDEPEASAETEKVDQEETKAKDSEEKDEKKEEEILKPTEMDIDEDSSPQQESKDGEPKNPPSQEPIAIDDDDLSMDEKDGSMDKLISESVGKKRSSVSSDYEERSKRMKLSDDSEKDTDTNSQSSIPSKKDVDAMDSTSRQSETSGDSLKMTLKLRGLEKLKENLEVEKISQAEKDVGSLLTPLPKKTSMEFMTRFKKPFQDMSHADLEDFVLQKIAEQITHKSEYSELRKKVEKQEELISLYRTKLTELSKNFHDLEVVYKRVQQDLDNRNAGYVQIPKITRAVGLQVSVSNHRKQLGLSTSHNEARQSAQEATRKMKPVQRFTPMRPPMTEAEQRNLESQEQRQRQELQQQVQQKLALNAANISGGTTTIAQRNSNIVVLKHTPKPPPVKIIQPQPYVVKRTAVRTSTITSTVVTKTVSPAGIQQRVVLSPSVSAHSQQSPTAHKVPVQSQQRSPTIATPAKKQQVVVDLTDEDDSKAKVKIPTTQSLLNGGIPALVAIPSSSSNSKTPPTKYVMVQQMAATNGQLSKTMPLKYGNRIKNFAPEYTESPKKIRGFNVNTKQRIIYVDFYTDNRDALDPESVHYESKWEKLSEQLNNAGPPRKDMYEWMGNFRNWIYQLHYKKKNFEQKLTNLEKRALDIKVEDRPFNAVEEDESLWGAFGSSSPPQFDPVWNYPSHMQKRTQSQTVNIVPLDNNSKIRGLNVTMVQRNVFVDFCTTNIAVMDPTSTDYQSKWEELCRLLDDAGPPQKEIDEWIENFRNWIYQLRRKKKMHDKYDGPPMTTLEITALALHDSIGIAPYTRRHLSATEQEF
ncbi:uncharacterized protein LOC132259670 isoform X2 [Phlebotomus argentipes]|uniref:uncharacterized protein LOC132259670 isoform X2 n=1 Tax=Phlebotomus argentipes TaxID=94469 RepID=UPI0028932D11|nr:uncharacterized protein LOC132259670 isoform X2 [Phlebotomus argentipes]